jgi:hypothetical protein
VSECCICLFSLLTDTRWERERKGEEEKEKGREEELVCCLVRENSEFKCYMSDTVSDIDTVL